MTTPRTFTILHVAGARPNFMKVAPVMSAIAAWRSPDVAFRQVLVHTGQHYDPAMSDVFFRDLDLPRPDYSLNIGSGSHAQQTADVLVRLEPVLLQVRPHLVVTVGDVNSTLAAALCAEKIHMPVAHVEAGLRSRDREMPEEINRLLTDQLSTILFTTSQDADENLLAEGIDAARVHLVGNTMIDTVDRLYAKTDGSASATALGLPPRGYALVTLHRPSNVDDVAQLAELGSLLEGLAERLPVLFPVHARTAKRLDAIGWLRRLGDTPRIVLTEPLGYLEFLGLMGSARLALTDSGGIQEETTVLGVPCLTLRTTTERPVTVTDGTNRLVDPRDQARILAAVDETLAVPRPTSGRRPYLWDGHAGERIVAVIADWIRQTPQDRPPAASPAGRPATERRAAHRSPSRPGSPAFPA